MEYAFRSDEEKDFAVWLDMAKSAGLVVDWSYEPETFTLVEPKKYSEEVQMKTKTKVVERHLLNAITYTPDFRVELTDLGVGRLEDLFKKSLKTAKQKNIVWIDTKGTFNMYGGDKNFSILQRLTYDITGIYVEKVVPENLFKKTFAPESVRWIKGRKNPTLTKLGKNTVTMEEFLKENK